MTKDSKTLGKVVRIDDHRIQDHLGELVRGTVEEMLNGMLDAEADALCGAQRYERSPDRVYTRAGSFRSSSDISLFLQGHYGESTVPWSRCHKTLKNIKGWCAVRTAPDYLLHIMLYKCQIVCIKT